MCKKRGGINIEGWKKGSWAERCEGRVDLIGIHFFLVKLYGLAALLVIAACFQSRDTSSGRCAAPGLQFVHQGSRRIANLIHHAQEVSGGRGGGRSSFCLVTTAMPQSATTALCCICICLCKATLTTPPLCHFVIFYNQRWMRRFFLGKSNEAWHGCSKTVNVMDRREKREKNAVSEWSPSKKQKK